MEENDGGVNISSTVEDFGHIFPQNNVAGLLMILGSCVWQSIVFMKHFLDGLL